MIRDIVRGRLARPSPNVGTGCHVRMLRTIVAVVKARLQRHFSKAIPRKHTDIMFSVHL